MEQWKAIRQYKGQYLISSYGRVKNNHGRILKVNFPTNNRHGRIVLKKNHHYIHNLVLEYFASKRPSEDYYVNHKNNNIRDNRIENLEYKKSIICRRGVEEWKDIFDFDNYQISSYGRIRSWKTIGQNKAKGIPSILSQSISHHGYCMVRLSNNNKSKLCVVHRLVAEYFVNGKSDSNCIVHHINGDKQLNHISNLEWTTLSDHIIKTKDLKPNYKKIVYRLNNAKVIEIKNMLAKGSLIQTVADKYNVSINQISNIRCGYSWSKAA